MAIKKSFHTDALPTLSKVEVLIVIHKGKRVVDGIEYDLVEKIPFHSKKYFLHKFPAIKNELGDNYKIMQKIDKKWQCVERVK